MEALDFIFAKGKLSAEMGAVCPRINLEQRFSIKQGRHPLLNRSSCVPLDFFLGDGVQGLVITGPNTGGKTVSLKTVGLFTLMAQSPVSYTHLRRAPKKIGYSMPSLLW